MEFFAAPDDTAAASVLRTGTVRGFASFTVGNLDPEEALVAWECLLTGGGFEDPVGAGEPRVVAEADHGEHVVLALSPRLAAALTGTEHSRLCEVAVAWAGQRAAEGAIIDADVARAIVGDPAVLVAGAERRDEGVYCRAGSGDTRRTGAVAVSARERGRSCSCSWRGRAGGPRRRTARPGRGRCGGPG